MCALLLGYPLPGSMRARQGRVIRRNLLASIDAKPLAPYVPQQRYWGIFNLGQGQGLASWGPLWWRGKASMWLKNRIDHRFMRQYQIKE